MSLISMKVLRLEYHSTLTRKDMDPEVLIEVLRKRENRLSQASTETYAEQVVCQTWRVWFNSCNKNKDVWQENKTPSFLHLLQCDVYLSGGQRSTQAACSSTTLTHAEHWSGLGPVQSPRHSSWQLFLLFLKFWQTSAFQHLEFSQLAGQVGHKGPSLLLAAKRSPLRRMDPQSTVST